MNTDIQTTSIENRIPAFMVDEPQFSDQDLDDMLATFKSHERPLVTEKPVTLMIALVIVTFFATIFGAGLVWVPNFISLKAFHSLALATGSITLVALAGIHVLGARIRQL